MRKLKLFFVAMLTAFCCFAFSACELVMTGVYMMAGIVGWATNEDKDAPTSEELRMPVEITEGAVIVEVTQNEEGFYLAKTVGAIKCLGDKDADEFNYKISYYDADGFLLDTIAIYEDYIGPGDTYKVEYEAELFFEPATARIWDVEVYAAYDYKTEREHKAQVEVLEGETLTCELGEDGLYHATVTGQVKLLTDYESTMYLRVAFYDANGYMYVREWKKTVYGPAERTYTVECTAETEIVSCKVVYASTLNYSVNY